MSDKALRMLEHMRKQIVGQPARYVEVRGAAISIGVDPGQSECDGLVEELLRDGHLQRYSTPSLTAHGLYRLTDSGISAVDGAQIAPVRYGGPAGGRTEAVVAEGVRRRIGGNNGA